MNPLLSGFFREGPAATPSMTRLSLFLCVLAGISPIAAWTIRFMLCEAAPDLPGNVIIAQAAILGMPMVLKGWERQQVEQTKQIQAGTTTVSETKVEVTRT